MLISGALKWCLILTVYKNKCKGRFYFPLWYKQILRKQVEAPFVVITHIPLYSLMWKCKLNNTHLTPNHDVFLLFSKPLFKEKEEHSFPPHCYFNITFVLQINIFKVHHYFGVFYHAQIIHICHYSVVENKNYSRDIYVYR